MAMFIPLLVGTAGTAGVAGAAGTAATAGLFGAGGAATLGATAATLSAAAGVGSAVAGVSAGKAAEQQAIVEGQNTKVQANQASLERRERLIRALALQNAKVGAGGITQAGSPTQVKLEDIRQFKAEDNTASTLSKVAGAQISKKGSTARKSANRGAGISLLSTGAEFARNT